MKVKNAKKHYFLSASLDLAVSAAFAGLYNVAHSETGVSGIL